MFVYDATLRVPLLIRLPGGGGGGRRVSGPVETADIAPTIASLTGAALRGPVDGRSLVPDLRQDPGDDRTVYAETYYAAVLLGWSPLRAVRTVRWKFVEAPRVELYDLDADPGERRNVAIERSTQARALAAQLPDAVPRDGAPAQAATPVGADAERLRTLGYVAGRTQTDRRPAPDPKDRVEIWAKIEDAIERMSRDASGAERLLRDALARDAGNGMAFKYLGDALARQGRLEDAVSAYRQAIEHGFEHADTFLNLGTYERRLGREREAARALEAGLALDPGAVDGWNQLGILRARAGDRDGARTAFDRVVALAPDRAEAYYNLAVIARDTHRDDEASTLIRKALDRNPRYVEALVVQGHLALAAGHAADALAAYRAALAERPEDPEALYSAGRAAVALHARTEAAGFFTRFLAVAPASLAPQRAAAERELARLRR
jgi:tetratricopeptide (TPR) repeat protein